MQKNGSPRPEHKASTGSPRIDPSQRVGLPRVYPSSASTKTRVGSVGAQRQGGAIKLLGGRGTAGQDTTHQLSLTSLASDYNIVAAVDKHHHHAAAVGRLVDI